MPQFDISSFPVQIFWLFVLLTIIYVFISYKFLPNTLFLIKLRGKLSHIKHSEFQKISIKDTNFYNNYKA